LTSSATAVAMAHLKVHLQLLHALNGHVPCLTAAKVYLLGRRRKLEAREGCLQGLVEGMEFTVPEITAVGRGGRKTHSNRVET